MPRLIFAGHTGHCVGFIVGRLKWHILTLISANCLLLHQNRCVKLILPQERIKLLFSGKMKKKKKDPVSNQNFQHVRDYTAEQQNTTRKKHTVWATSWQNLLLPYANNRGADQCNTSICYSRNFKTLASLCSWAGRFESYLWSQTPKTGFLMTSSYDIWTTCLWSVLPGRTQTGLLWWLRKLA